MRYYFHPEAAVELDESFQYYERDHPGRGRRFLEKVQACIVRICQFPLLGTQEEPNIRRMLVNRFPYKLLYSVHDDSIVILAVAHCHRMPRYWQDRTSVDPLA